MDNQTITTLKAQRDRIEWYHRIDLGPELGTTAGSCLNDWLRLSYMHLPDNLVGLRALDVGAWDGFFSFEAEKRGASVVATDVWGDYQSKRRRTPNTADGILFAKTVKNSRIETQYASVYNLSEEIWEKNPTDRFDLVLFPGVLYHLKEPLQALSEIRKVMRDGALLILETHLDLVSLDRPAMALYSGEECGEDETNFIGPNRLAVETLLRWSGFQNIEFKGGINLTGQPSLENIQYARGAFHARR